MRKYFLRLIFYKNLIVKNKAKQISDNNIFSIKKIPVIPVDTNCNYEFFFHYGFFGRSYGFVFYGSMKFYSTGPWSLSDATKLSKSLRSFATLDKKFFYGSVGHVHSSL